VCLVAIQDEIQSLSSKSDLTPAQKTRLSSLKEELANVKKSKDKYLQEHPEHRKIVYKENAPQASSGSSSTPGNALSLYDKEGKLRDPKKSVYYDPVLNPYGVPPPGMPYLERRGLLCPLL
jgi:hypothetical protein